MPDTMVVVGQDTDRYHAAVLEFTYNILGNKETVIIHKGNFCDRGHQRVI